MPAVTTRPPVPRTPPARPRGLPVRVRPFDKYHSQRHGTPLSPLFRTPIRGRIPAVADTPYGGHYGGLQKAAISRKTRTIEGIRQTAGGHPLGPADGARSITCPPHAACRAHAIRAARRGTAREEQSRPAIRRSWVMPYSWCLAAWASFAGGAGRSGYRERPRSQPTPAPVSVLLGSTRAMTRAARDRVGTKPLWK